MSKDRYDYKAGVSYKVLRTGLKPPSSNYSIIECPFCQQQSRAYWWSISGGGKRCENKKCGAMFNSAGTAYPALKKEPKK
jgi:hypothetical protein